MAAAVPLFGWKMGLGGRREREEGEGGREKSWAILTEPGSGVESLRDAPLSCFWGPLHGWPFLLN